MSAVLPSAAPAAARRAVAAGTVVEVLGDIASLQALVPQWEALAADAAEPNPFYEHWMLIPALQAYGADAFRCVAVWQDGTLAALFPMWLQRRFRGLPVPALRSYRHRNMLACTPLLRAKHLAKSLAALLDEAPAPVMEFDWTPTGGLFYGALAEAMSSRGLPWLVTDAYERALLLRERDPRERYNSNTRNNLRRCQSRLEAIGKVAPARLSPGDDLEAWTQEFMRLEASGWKGRAGTALRCREDDRRFVAAVFPEAFRRGRLLLTGLDLGGRALARHVIFTAGEGAWSFKLAYDEAHEKCSPGLLGEVDNVRQFLETPGLRWLDSNTARESPGYWRVWKDRLAVQRVAVGLRGAGQLAVAFLPLSRIAKKALIRPAQNMPGE
jgi:CelD/BcsL family acetyltransferase involved in cellulose biosynthesis